MKPFFFVGLLLLVVVVSGCLGVGAQPPIIIRQLIEKDINFMAVNDVNNAKFLGGIDSNGYLRKFVAEQHFGDFTNIGDFFSNDINAISAAFLDGTVATTPSSDTDIANKKYVDDEIVSEAWLLATNQTGITGNKAGTFTFNNLGSNVFGSGVKITGTLTDVSLLLHNTTGFGTTGSLTINIQQVTNLQGGKIVFGREGAFSNPGNRKSFLDFYTANNGNKLALRINSNQDVIFERSLHLTDGEGIFFGIAQDASIKFNGSDMIINSENVTADDELHITNFDSVLIRELATDVSLVLTNSTGTGTTGTTSLQIQQQEGRKGGKLVWGREGIYLNPNQRDSFFEIYTATDGVDVLALRINSNQDANFDGNISFPGAYGEMHTMGMGITIDFSIINDYNAIGGLHVGTGTSNNLEIADNNHFVIIIPGIYLVGWNSSFSSSGGGNKEYETSILINDLNTDSGTAHRKTGNAGDIGNAAGTGIINVVAGDKIALGVANHTDTTGIDIEHATLSMTYIGKAS